VVDFVGESGANGLLERRRSSGELRTLLLAGTRRVQVGDLTFLHRVNH
jgi:hypothetical protein